jgi:hypothetical protein
MDLSETQYSFFDDNTQIPQDQKTIPLNNYISPKDEFHSLNIQFDTVPKKVNLIDVTRSLPTAGPEHPAESFVSINDIQSDSYVELNNYKMNHPGQGSLVNIQKILEQLKSLNIPVGNPLPPVPEKPKGSGYVMYEGFADLDVAYTEESILFHADGVASRLYIGALSVAGLLILYRMLKL